MTVVVQTPFNSHVGNGVTTVFGFTFQLLDADDLVVSIDGVVQVSSLYSISGLGVQAGGSITFLSAPANGAAVLLAREIALQREIDYQNNGDLRADTVDLDFNRIWQALQGIFSRLTGALRAPYPEQLPELPAAADRANRLLSFDTNGNPVVVAPTSDSSTELRLDLASAAAGDGAALVGFDWALLPAAINKIDWGLRTAGSGINLLRYIPPAQWAAIFAGTSTYDATADVQAAIDFCADFGESLHAPAGRYFFNGGKLNILKPLYFSGAGVGRTVFVFGGSPVTEVVTFVDWQVAYNTGDYSSSVDAPRAWGIRIANQAADTTLRDFTVTTDHDANAVYPLPFDSATDFPTSGYTDGILVQRHWASLINIRCAGVFSRAALCIDGTLNGGGGIGDRFFAENSYFAGAWGVRIDGPQGEPISGDDFEELVFDDVRAAGGMSDITFVGCQLVNTGHFLRLRIDTGLGIATRIVRRGPNMGGLRISGQISRNSARRIQGMRFFSCRFAANDPYIYFINYANRVEFVNCHSEGGSGFDVDAVTALPSTASQVRTTANARSLIFIGGEKSGETDGRTFTDVATGVRIITELGFENPTPPSGSGDGRHISGIQLGDRGTWTPALTASTPGTPAYTIQSGSWQRVGNMVFIQGRITMSSISGMVGTLLITGLPFNCTTRYAANGDFSLNFGLVSNVTMGSGGIGGYVNDGGKTISLWKLTSGSSAASLGVSDLSATSRIDFSAWYVTEDA